MPVQSKEDPVMVLYNYYRSLFRSQIHQTPRPVKLAATIALVLSILSSGYGGWRLFRVRSKEKAQGRTIVRKNSGLRGKAGERIIYVPKGDTTSRVIIHPTRPTTFDAHRRLFLTPPRVTRLGGGTSTPAYGPPPAQTKPGLNLAFLHQFLSLANIMVPRFRSKETALLLSHAVFLVLRTYLSLLVARLDGAIVRDLVSGHGKQFLLGLLRWLSIGTLASYTNSMIRFLQAKLSIAFRTRLTRYIHDLYLDSNLTYYKLTNLDGGVEGADQFITQDLTLFCTAAASLYSSLGKPLVDIFVFNYQLYRSLGPLALTGLLLNYFGTATFLRRLSPPFGKLKAVEGKKEGDFRGLHSRLIANAEEVAFYGGADVEKVYLDRSFKELRSWMEGIYNVKVRYNMLEDFILKYSWSAFGYVISSIPIYLPAWAGLTSILEASGSTAANSTDSARAGSHMKDFTTNKRLMLSLSDAGGRMMYSIKDLSELAGYTSRVYQLISTLHRVHANAYAPNSRRASQRIELYSQADVQGTIHYGFDGVRLEDVPVVAPGMWPYGGDELIESLSFHVRNGEHLLISGSNGVGKSSISRIVGGLWPVYRGLVSRPRNNGLDGIEIMFIPQRPYLSIGTLRDQVIYPHTEMDMRDNDRQDSDLERVLEEAKLGHLLSREGGWDTRKEWKDVLSGGEKQRMAIARVFFHRPHYAILDEGTSAVSSDVEGLLYERCEEKGITVITLSTRASLRKYHSFNLILGIGDEGFDWEMVRIGTQEEKSGVEKEIGELKQKLANVEKWERRRSEIQAELNQVFVVGNQDSAEGNGNLGRPDYLDDQSASHQ